MKDGPAFQLYAADFYMDTISWSNEDVGAYLRLLLSEWINGPLDFNAKKLAKTCQISAKRWPKRWQIIGQKFTLNDDGKLINERLEKEREKQHLWREKSSLGGKKSAEKRARVVEPSHQPTGQPNDQPKGNSSLFTLQSSLNSPKKETLSQLLFDLILKRRPNFKKPNLTTWAKSIDLMIRVDKRNPDEIEKVIKWCQADEFWQNNILSTAKLRKQFDQLALKANKMVIQNVPSRMKCKKCGDSGQYISIDENGLCANCRYKGE